MRTRIQMFLRPVLLRLRPVGLVTFLVAVLAPAAAASAGDTTRVSVTSSGQQLNGFSYDPDISGDGRFVAFVSYVSNLVVGDTNNAADVFVRDLQTSSVTRVNVGAGGGQANGDSLNPKLSANGRFVVFVSAATNLVPGDSNDTLDVFVHDRLLGTTARASVGAGGQGSSSAGWPAISADGRFVAFATASPLVAGDANGLRDVFVRDTVAGSTTRASVEDPGVVGVAGTSLAPALSGDGGFVVFASNSSRLVAGDTTQEDIFVRDLVAGTTTLVSVSSAGAHGNNYSVHPDISDDGSVVAFGSAASNLVSGDTNNALDMFVRTGGVTVRANVGPGGTQSDEPGGTIHGPRLSGNGLFLAFQSAGTNLVAGDTNGAFDVFVHVLQTSLTERASVTDGGVQGNGHSLHPALSGDGSSVVFDSAATNLVPGDTNAQGDVFLHELADVNAAPSVTASAGTGAEDSPIGVSAEVTDDGSPSISWSYAAGPGIDAGATCAFADPSAAATTIACTDDGSFTVTVTVDDGINPAVSASAPLDVANADPSVEITSPAAGASFAVGAPVALTTSTSDPGSNDTVTCSIDWGDGAVESGCADAHAYAADGTYTITVTATDDDGGTATDSETITVNRPPRSAPDQITELIALIESFNLRWGLENSLDAKLRGAQDALTATKAGDLTSACNKLGAFVNEVEAQSGKALTTTEANQLVAAATQIKAALGCP